MQKILFLCTGNSCRSQMAHGFANFLKGDGYQFYSAGTKKHGLNPKAVQVMQEVGVDISGHESNTTDEVPQEMDVVFTVCQDAHENCPYFPGGKIIHVGFDDPPRLTKEMSDEEEILNVYRRVRDEIKSFIENIEQHL
jgi:arsenate reductase